MTTIDDAGEITEVAAPAPAFVADPGAAPVIEVSDVWKLPSSLPNSPSCRGNSSA